ncbi:hypothetical protein A3A14_03650 [Candidatus Daviesbacteria bacterium RIFCSPLOWO2_01_FULL_43_38]|nr:MAG: hypothetical protein A2874_00360 [Candidatus Daviesbacteria bacterium RIFCSPHIGHO2_01_FULL_43_17]OGE37026.1 MAG: hypothetical protein A3E45_02150 [Candidatus Daviesbacteria bacterium RIFCSPHIGHO2_12_FULL_43_11]OGE63905.1 MAG: hypothetical protein A3A14_03650 [Candidatus Daviesbacteria bacterium RIFCSPLOWO2_01_FULL_43_38]OGE70704.1 MAG: hypothetical protein A3J21_03585 [Candidatus Daviesbacteria bacterium RIFCSPLOWO2_02_FULL_43_11]
MSGIESTSEDNPVFADERAKLAWAIAKAVDSLTATLPPEGQKLEARLITFDANDAREASRGRYAIFLAGTVIGTDQKGVFLVPGRSLKILEMLNIPYQEMPD